MVEELLHYERSFFLWLNGLHNEYWDSFMWLFSGKIVWMPIALFIIFILVKKAHWRESLLILLFIALVVTFCDQIASGFCKPFFMRFRPTHHPDFESLVHTVYGYRGGTYGFISSHAANAFGFVTFLAFLFKCRLFSIVLFIWATLTAYSRIYLGVHFISDVVFGAILGCLVGYLLYRVYKQVRAWLLKARHEREAPHYIYKAHHKNMISYGMIVSIATLLFFHSWLILFLR